MPRTPRIALEGFPLHVVQRGNDRQACFRSDHDRSRYLAILLQVARRHGCALHAYVLMTNHVHLLLTSEQRGGISALMQNLGRWYVGEFNSRHGRTGTLWEGRFRSSVVSGYDYVMACYRYIELNPVRAGIVSQPGRYRWSSYHVNGEGRTDALVTPHEAYRALGDSAERVERYRQLVASGLEDHAVAAIRANLQQGRAYANEALQLEIETRIGRPARVRKRGRPRKKAADDQPETDRIFLKKGL
jgi:putative transposase